MAKVLPTPYHSWRIGRLSAGCRACVRGAKLVLLATGVCGSRCWYCPLSERKKDKDVVVANEWWVKKDADIIEEARLTGAEGAGITGGDPLCRLERTLHYIRLLKRRFGKGFHIHLYTPTERAAPTTLKRLHSAGLDEIRFHPDFLKGEFGLETLGEALKLDWDVGCEIPVVPNHMRQTKAFIRAIDGIGVRFLNLNQLEVSETNAKALMRRGYEAESDVSFAVRGSERMARVLLGWCARNTRLRVHYCTVKLKDAVQLRNRLRRRAKNVAKCFDIVTDEGLLVRGALYLKDTMPSFSYSDSMKRMTGKKKMRLLRILRITRKNLLRCGLPSRLIEVDECRLRLLTGAEVAQENADAIKEIGLMPTIVEEYPTWDGLITDLLVL